MRIRGRADGDRVGSGRGRACGPQAEEVPVVPGGDDRDDACADDVRDRLDERIRSGIGLRAAAGEVDDVHPVADRLLERLHDLGRRPGAAATERQRHVEDAVVPDVRARRDAAHVGDRWMARPLVLGAEPGPARRNVGAFDPGDHAGDEGPVEGLLPVDRAAARAGAGEALGHDHLRRRAATRPLREAGRIREACRREERVLVVDAVVDDGDLHAIALRPRQPRELRCADDRGAPVQERRVRVARVHLLSDSEVEQVGELRVGDADDEPVQQHLVAARDPRLGQRAPTLAIARSWATSRRLRYERENELAKFSFRRVPTVAKALRGAAVARGGSSSVTITRTRDDAFALGASGLTLVEPRLGALDHVPRSRSECAGSGSGEGDEER